MQQACQITIAVLLIAAFFSNVSFDFHGRKASPPGGMPGFIGTLIVTSIVAALYYGAGSFSLLIR